jgi:putative hydrolase of the HAD superfamily
VAPDTPSPRRPIDAGIRPSGRPSPVRGVIFDLDDTLIDHRGSAVRALRLWLPTLGVTPSDTLIDAWFEAEDRHFPRWSSGEITYAEQRRDRLRDVLPAAGLRPGDDEDLDRMFGEYLARYRDSWVTFEDVGPALGRLHHAGVAVAVLSNGVAEQQRAKVAATGFGDLLGPVLTPDTIGCAKPDPNSFLTVCRSMELPPAAVLHVGDRYDLDVVAPRAAGLQAVHLDRWSRGPLDEPARITTLAQLSVL